MNLLVDPVFTLPPGDKKSVAAVFASMARGEIAAFPALRPHQRPAWHMFLVQLGALASRHANLTTLPTDIVSWRTALRDLTPDYPDDEPWRLVVEQRDKPGFLQPPDPGGLKWTYTPTPDALDMLITARNHDLKQSVAKNASAEDWVFALVSLQTCEGYGGRDNQGIARMNGGASSRPMLGLVPTRDADFTVHAGAHWLRDVRELLARRTAGQEVGLGKIGGDSLLWLLPWPERAQLNLSALDPWFIEVCRRVRLVARDGAMRAQCANSKAPRIDAKARKGNVGDPWAPVHRTEGKSLTITSRGFDYRLLCNLLYSGDWQAPFLAQPAPEESHDMLLLAEAISRGNSKTDGFKSRVVPVPGRVLRLLSSRTLGSLAEAQTREIAGFDKALRNGLATMATAGKVQKPQKKHYEHTNAARARFERRADQEFFPSLWGRLAASNDAVAIAAAKVAFLRQLKRHADEVFNASLPEVPCSAILRDRARARARRAYEGTLRSDEACRDLFAEERADVVT